MKKIYKISIGVVLALILITSFSINYILKGVITTTLEERTGLNISINSLWINPFTGTISSRGITVLDEERELFLLKSFKLDTAPAKLLKGKLHVEEHTLIEPTLDISKKDKGEKEETEPSPKETIPPEKTTGETKGEDKEPFIKEVVVKNVTIRNLTLKGEETVLKSLNTLTLEVPDFLYKDEILDLTAALDVVDSGLLNLVLKANTKTGEVDATLGSEALNLTSSFTTPLDTLDFTGGFAGEFHLTGNYQTKDFKVTGGADLNNFIVLDSSKAEISKVEYIKINLKELRYPELFISSTGEYSLTSTDGLLQLAVKSREDISGSMDNLSLKGSFDLNYPLLELNPEVNSTDIQIAWNKTYNLSLAALMGVYDIAYNIDERSYLISGSSTVNSLKVLNEDKEKIFNGNLAVDLDKLSKEEILVSSLTLDDFFADLDKLPGGDDKSPPVNKGEEEKKEAAPSPEDKETSDLAIYVKDVYLKDGQAVYNKKHIEDLNLTAKNISNTALNSPVNISGVFDSAPFKGDLVVNLKDMKDFSDLAVKGKVSIQNLNIDSIGEFLKDIPYDLSGIISYDSYIDYSKDSITTKGTFEGNKLQVQNSEGMDLSLNNLNAKLNLTLMGKDMRLKNTTANFTEVNGSVSDDLKLNLPRGRVSLKSYTPSEVNFNLISLTNPDISIYKKEETVEGTDKNAEGPSPPAGPGCRPGW